jgi:hypothetical protein
MRPSAAPQPQAPNQPNVPRLPTKLGEETTIAPPQRNPLIDKFAGQKVGDFTVPAKKELPQVDGIQQTIWPSGKITARKVGLSDAEKNDLKLQQDEQRSKLKEKENEQKEELKEKGNQQKSDLKASQKTYDDAKELVESARDYKKLKELNEKNITGIIPGRLAKMGMSTSEDLGSFSGLATRAQGKLSKFLSSRGGAVALQTAAPGKPNAGSQMAYNRGLINEGIETIKQQFKDLQDAYEKTSGKKLDITLPDFEAAEKGEGVGKSVDFVIKDGKLVKAGG